MALSDSAGIGSALPSQIGVTSGYVLQTDGALASWVSAAASSLPSQGGNSGKYLTTNGTDASWAAVSALPDQATHAGEYLTTNGTTASWAASPGGVTTLAAVGATPNADGATISGGNTLNLEPADATRPGVVTAGTQTFGGNKTIAGILFDAAAPSVMSAGNAYVQFSGGNLILGFNTAGKMQFSEFGVDRMVLFPSNLDMTGLGVGGAIKLKSPDGTTYTITVANGGTWNIA